LIEVITLLVKQRSTLKRLFPFQRFQRKNQHWTSSRTLSLVLLPAKIWPEIGCQSSWKVTLDVNSNQSPAHRRNSFPNFLEPGLSDFPNSPAQPRTKNKVARLGGSIRPQTAPPKTRFTFPGIGRNPEEPVKANSRQIPRKRKTALLGSAGSKRVRKVVNVLRMIFRMRKLSQTDMSPSNRS
jgi:hypothetical protein